MANDSNQGLEVVNLKELDKLLKKLPLDMQAKIWKGTNKEVGKIMLEEFKNKVPPKFSHLTAAIVIGSDKYNKSGVLVGIRAPRSAKKDKNGEYADKDKGYILRWVEYGTSQRETKGGANRGVFQPSPFMSKAVDIAEPKMLRFINEEYGEEMNKIIERNIKSEMRKLNKALRI